MISDISSFYFVIRICDHSLSFSTMGKEMVMVKVHILPQEDFMAEKSEIGLYKLVI